MSEAPQAVRSSVLHRDRQVQLARVVLAIGSGAAALILVGSAIVGWLSPEFPANLLIPLVLAYLVMVGVSYGLLRRGQFSWAVLVYLFGTGAGLLVGVYFLNGVTGPLTVALVTIPVLAALLGGYLAARRSVALLLLAFLTMVVLERLGLLQPGQVPPQVLRPLYVGMFVLTLSITTFLVSYSVRLTTGALFMAQQRERELADASHEAEQSALSERDAREREERTARQLRRAIRLYSTFLEQISAGEYAARLDMEALGGEGAFSGELQTLGQRLNDTVEALVQALSDLRAVQRRYVREAWEGVASGVTHRGFRYADREIAAADEAWLPPMDLAIKSREVAADDGELGIPITLRGEVIGAIGVRRQEPGGWADEELDLARNLVGQLSQTMESLRLLDETQRRAAQDRLIGEVSARIRETLDMEAVLRTTADEMYQALQLDEVVVRLVPELDDQDKDGHRPPAASV